MVHVMVIGAGPEGKEVMQTPGEFVAGVSIDGLEEAEDDPNIHGDNMQVFCERTEGDGDSDASEGEDHGFKGRGILCGKTEGCAVLMVQLVNQLVQAGLMESAVEPVMPGIFEDEEQGDLPGHGNPRREGD